jgi:hypothetical protein
MKSSTSGLTREQVPPGMRRRRCRGWAWTPWPRLTDLSVETVRMRALLVEDDTVSAQAPVKELERQQISGVRLSDGRSALEALDDLTHPAGDVRNVRPTPVPIGPLTPVPSNDRRPTVEIVAHETMAGVARRSRTASPPAPPRSSTPAVDDVTEVRHGKWPRPGRTRAATAPTARRGLSRPVGFAVVLLRPAGRNTEPFPT